MIVPAMNGDERRTLVKYVADRIGETPQALVGDMHHSAIGVVHGNEIKGAIIFLNYRRQSCEFHLAGSPGWLKRGEIGRLFAFPFVDWGCLRLWCMIRRNNKQARLGALRLGFKVLGVADDEFGEGKDGIIYSMKKSDCKWINGYGQGSCH